MELFRNNEEQYRNCIGCHHNIKLSDYEVKLCWECKENMIHCGFRCIKCRKDERKIGNDIIHKRIAITMRNH